MPEFTVKEVRLPELHFPEIKRDDIVRSLSGRLSDVDLAKARNAKIKVPTVTLTTADVGKIVAAGTAVARFARPAKRRRWLTGGFRRGSSESFVRLIQPKKRNSRRPFVILALVAVAVAAWAVLRRPAVRQRMEELGQDARERFETMRAETPRLDVDRDEPTTAGGFDTMASSEAQGFVNATEDAGTTTPGSTDDATAFEEAGKPT
jgi:hypothetical protein